MGKFQLHVPRKARSHYLAIPTSYHIYAYLMLLVSTYYVIRDVAKFVTAAMV